MKSENVFRFEIHMYLLLLGVSVTWILYEIHSLLFGEGSFDENIMQVFVSFPNL